MRKLTSEEHCQGYIVCGCEKYAYVFSAEALAKLSKQCAQVCDECHLNMIPAEEIERKDL